MSGLGTDGQNRKGCGLQVVGLESCRQIIMTDSSHESIARYREMIVGKRVEEQSSQNRTMLRCTRDSACAIAQMCRQSAEVEVLTDVANVKDNLLVHKRDSHNCVGLGNMRTFGFNPAEQAGCALT